MSELTKEDIRTVLLDPAFTDFSALLARGKVLSITGPSGTRLRVDITGVEVKDDLIEVIVRSLRDFDVSKEFEAQSDYAGYIEKHRDRLYADKQAFARAAAELAEE